MTILDGKKLADKILINLKKEIKKKRLKLTLAVVLVGENMTSKSYINKKREACERVGIKFIFFNFPAEIGQGDLEKEIKKIANDTSVSGIVIQLPLSKNFDTQKILNFIPSEKDPDVLTDTNFEKFLKNETEIIPPVVAAIKCLFEEYNINIRDKKIVLVGKGRLVGKPLAIWLKNQGIDFELIDKQTKNVSTITKKADIIISGAGSPNLIKRNIIKKGVILIDVGAAVKDGKIKGDIEILAYKKASYVAPVPGGVGPVAVACLLKNLINLNQK